MKTHFFPAPDVAEMGERLVEEHHTHLIEHQARIEYVFRSETATKNGREVWGQARKISSLGSFLRREKEINWNPGLSDEELAAIADEDERDLATIERKFVRENALNQGNAAFFVITISKPIWELLDDAGKLALVDHELMHCGACYDNDGKTKLYMIEHDFEGFNAEIARHGLWRQNAVSMAQAMKSVQLKLGFAENASR